MKHLQSSTVFSLLALATGIATSACGGSTTSGGSNGGKDAGGSGDGSANNLDGGSGGDDGGGTGDDAGGGDDGGGGVIDAGPAGIAVPLYSCLGLSYSVPTTIGTQDFEMILDTGSTSMAVAGSSCTTCGVSPEYTPGSTATDEKQATNAQYGSGSWNGEVYQDDVALAPATAFPLKFASMTSQNGFFNQTLCDSKGNTTQQGILGMGQDIAISPGTEGYFAGLVAAQKVPNLFSIELCDSGGTLTLGGVDSSVMTAAPQYVPMIASGGAQGYYTIGLASVTVNGVETTIGSGAAGEVIVDTGTSTFLVSTTVYAGITNSIKNAPGASAFLGASANTIFPAGGGGGTLSCGNITGTKAAIDAALPGMTFNFSNGVAVQATATESYLFPLQSEWCSGISGVPAQDLGGAGGIWGAPMHRSSVIIYDRQNATAKRIGFAPHTPCN